MDNRDAINRYILEGVKSGRFDKEMAKTILKEINRTRETPKDNIAIIGIACKFPCANNADEYWQNLKDGLGFIRLMPEDRVRDIGSTANNHMKAGWLENIAMFDAGFFRISPKEAICMHPSQRLFLETVWEALEDAGYANNKLSHSKTGVYAGIDHTYQMEYNKLTDEQDLLKMTGSMTSVLASRISYVLNLQGPNLVVDTACSSGLVSVHLACKALKNKECTMAIAGGLHLIRQINDRLEGVQSSDGRLSAFDKYAKGTVWGEGVCFIILKTLKKAIEDRDNIYAVIKGSAINNDGTTNGITAPSASTQSEVVVSAWEDAGIDPETISYIEAHATGTVLGDPIEVKGIKAAFEKYTQKKQFCGVGSVKPNIGHGVSVAAMSSLMKVILSIKNRQIPPNINFSEPNPYIDFANSPLYVNDRLKKWETNGVPMRAGVSSFGFSRTNCHMVLEEAPSDDGSTGNEARSQRPYVFTVSARSSNALAEYIKKYYSYILRNEKFNIGDLCFTAATGRMHLGHRLVMIVKDKADFEGKIRKLADIGFTGLEDENIIYGEFRIVADTLKQDISGEITQKEKKELDRLAKALLQELKQGSFGMEAVREICRLYIKGADVDWEELYEEQKPKRTSIPTYPFEHKHYWLKQREPAVQAGEFTAEMDYPLIDKCLITTLNQQVYLTHLDVDRHWVLTEHLIMNSNVLPGTAYVQIAHEAGKRFCGTDYVELGNILFLAPLVVERGEPKEVHTIVRREGNNLKFVVASKSKCCGSNTEDTWTVHTEGEIHPQPKGYEAMADIASIRENCGIYELEVDMSKPMDGFMFGPRWRNVSRVFVGEDKVLTELQIQEEYKADTNVYTIHPALLDNAINLAVQKLVHNVEDGIYLPMSFKSIKVYRPLPSKFYSYQTIKTPIVKGIQTVSLDVCLMNGEGQILAEINGYSIKKVRKEALVFGSSGEAESQYHEIGWVPKDLQETTKIAGNESMLLIKDGRGMAQEVIERLEAKGKHVIEAGLCDCFRKLGGNKYEIGSGENDYLRLAEEIKDAGITQIVHMASIDACEDLQSLEELEGKKEKGILSALFLTRALISNKIGRNISLVLVSDYANEVTGQETIIKPHNSSLFALGRVIKEEFSGISCRGVDIDASTSAEQLVNELSYKESVYQVAYRSGCRYVEEFKEYEPDKACEEKVEIKETGVYLITGGTGGIGLEAAKHIADKKKVNIALLNRSVMPEREKWDDIIRDGSDAKLCGKINAIRGIEGNGSCVVCCSVDISSARDMKALIGELRERYGRINGIIHSAGIAGEGILIKKDIEKFRRVLSPKMEGTWLLHKYTEQDKPDFFVMFSSILAFIGAMGQGDYAAANAYMDSFAAYRRKKGLKTAAISWSVWSQTGMALTYNADEVRGVFNSVTNAKGMEAFDYVLGRRIDRLVAGGLDYGRLACSNGEIGINMSPELRHKIERKCASSRPQTGRNEQKRNVNIIAGAGKTADDIEVKVAGVWAEVLALDEVSLYDNFNELGGDSIIATNLLKAMNKVFPDLLDISDVFTYPTIKHMAEYIREKTGTSAQSSRLSHKVQAAKNQKQPENTGDGDYSEKDIIEIMNKISRGEISAEEADELIK